MESEGSNARGGRPGRILVYGATGFTGELVCEYLQERYGSDGELRWGIAGRNKAKLEALRDRLGLNPDSFFKLCQGAAAQSWILENRCPVPGPAPAAPASNDYAPGFAARLMAKDLRLGQMAAQACGQETPFGAEAARRFTEFAEAGGGDLDFSAIYRTMRNNN